MDSLITTAIFLVLLLAIALPYWLKTKRKREEIAKKHETAVAAGLNVIATMHPRIDVLTCIGCGSCVKACPEDVLGLVNGKAAIVNGARCVGHALCAEACPVTAITMGFGRPRQGMELPWYDEHYETNVPGLFIVGELGGLGLIRNASNQGVKAIQHIASGPRATGELYDVAIVGAGPAGISAALAATENKLRYIALEQGGPGGSILHYPRQKLVLTNPITLPLHGTISKSELAKEDLIRIFGELTQKYSLNIRPHTKVDAVIPHDGYFSVTTGDDEIRATHVILALGRRGSPRKLGVPGEELQKVAYQLIEAESYSGKHILVVGGGDSAVEAAIGLSRQKGNVVTMSYRRDNFVRLKERNEQRIREAIKKGSVKVFFDSTVAAINDESVLIELKGQPDLSLRNDQVFVFAGGELPGEFLKAIGIKMRTEETEVALSHN